MTVLVKAVLGEEGNAILWWTILFVSLAESLPLVFLFVQCRKKFFPHLLLQKTEVDYRNHVPLLF